MNVSCRTYECVMSHAWMSHVIYMNKLCLTCESFMSHIWMCHVAHENAPCRTCEYRVIPGHRNHRNDPASVFLSTHWWSQHPACQRCFYKPLRNCHPSQRVSTPPVETLIFHKEDLFLIRKTDFWNRFLIGNTYFWDLFLIRKTNFLIRKTEHQFL